MNLDDGTNDINISYNPLFGYRTIIRLNTRLKQLDDGSFVIWDNGIANDSRECQCTFSLSRTETDDLVDFLTTDGKVRGKNVIMTLVGGEIPSRRGFFPFGPDKGDNVTFNVRFTSVTQRASIGYPQDWFMTDVTFVFNGDAWPEYTPPGVDSLPSQGDLQIGAITDMRYPAPMATPDISYAVKSTLTESGAPYFNDTTQSADSFITDLQMHQNEPKTAALVPVLQALRGSSIQIVSTANTYMFGVENESTAIYNCHFIQNTITIENPIWNDFRYDLKFYMDGISS